MSLKLWNPLILAQTTKMFSVLIIQKNNSTKSSKYFQNTEKMKINARGNGKKNRVVLRNGKTSADDSVALQNTQQVLAGTKKFSTHTKNT